MQPAICAAVAAAALFGAAQAFVSVNGKTYAVVDSVPGGTINQRIPAAYAAGERPARSSEWPAIVAAAGNNMANLLPNGAQFVLWDESNLQWPVMHSANNPSADPVPVANPAVTGALMLVNTNAAKNCPAGSSSPVNIVDSYPGVTLTVLTTSSTLASATRNSAAKHAKPTPLPPTAPTPPLSR
jgi:hypothetical protein